jgi:hypothetical protein
VPVTSQEGWVRARTRFGAWSLRHRKGGKYGYDDAILDILQDGKVEASIERDTTNGVRHRAYCITLDGETVISGGDNGGLTAYRLDGTKIGDFIGHEGDISWCIGRFPPPIDQMIPLRAKLYSSPPDQACAPHTDLTSRRCGASDSLRSSRRASRCCPCTGRQIIVNVSQESRTASSLFAMLLLQTDISPMMRLIDM